MHWADVVADKLLESGKEHVISSGITPSGPIHLGSMREILTADAVVRSVNHKGGKAKLVYIADNADPLRKVYPFLDNEKYEEFVGRPLAEIPAPNGEDSYDNYFLKPFFAALETVGIHPEVVDNYQYYKDGKYNSCIKSIMEKITTARDILETVSGRQLPKGWFPWTFKDDNGVLCNGKFISYEWPYVTFENKDGIEITNNLSKGEGKLPWRLDWPSKWKILGVTFEAFGKDHATKGGSFDTGKRIIRDILNRDEPHHIVYEWINLKGHGAMHSSTGLAISAEEMLRMAPPEVIRWLIMQPQPNRHIDFDPGLGLLNSVDKYDRLENDYYKQEAEENSARAFELSQVENKVREKTQILPYRHLVTLVQSKTEYDEIIDTLKRTGEIQDLNDYENKRLKSRIECIRGWLKTQAPDNVKFRIQEIPPDLDLDDSTAKKLNDIKNKMHSIDWNPDAIHNSFYELQDNNNTPAKEYFKIMYLIILGKERGPRLGFFLATMEKDFIIERLGHYLNP